MTTARHTLDWRPPKLRRRALAMWRRNLLVWRKLIGPSVMLNFGEPLIYLFGLGIGLGFFISDVAGMNYLTFLATGIMASSVMNTASFEGMYSVFTRMVPQRSYDALLVTPLELDDIIAGEMLWAASKSMLSGIAILLIAGALGAISPLAALPAVPVFFLVGLCFAGPAIMMSAHASGYDFFQYYFTLIITPMMMLSGVFFPIERLPDTLHILVMALPLTHAIDLIRPLANGGWPAAPLLNLAVLALYTLLGYYLAVVFSRRRFST